MSEYLEPSEGPIELEAFQAVQGLQDAIETVGTFNTDKENTRLFKARVMGAIASINHRGYDFRITPHNSYEPITFEKIPGGWELTDTPDELRMAGIEEFSCETFDFIDPKGRRIVTSTNIDIEPIIR
jgi:hypothetical protein